MIKNAKVKWTGVILGVVNDKIEIPFVMVDSQTKSDSNVPTGYSVADILREKICDRIEDEALHPIGANFTTSVQTGSLLVNMEVGRGHKDDSEDTQTVWNLFTGKLQQYADKVGLDENGRVVYNSVVPTGFNFRLEGDIELNEDGKAELQLAGSKLVALLDDGEEKELPLS